MGEITMKSMGQPYGTEAEMLEFLFPSRTSTQLQDVADSINTTGKFAGRQVWNTTTGLPAFATDGTPTGVWLSADITVGIDLTPS